MRYTTNVVIVILLVLHGQVKASPFNGSMLKNYTDGGLRVDVSSNRYSIKAYADEKNADLGTLGPVEMCKSILSRQTCLPSTYTE